MSDKISEHLKNIGAHSDALIRIPSSEQHIGNIQVTVSSALLEIKLCLEEIATEQERFAKEMAGL